MRPRGVEANIRMFLNSYHRPRQCTLPFDPCLDLHLFVSSCSSSDNTIEDISDGDKHPTARSQKYRAAALEGVLVSFAMRFLVEICKDVSEFVICTGVHVGRMHVQIQIYPAFITREREDLCFESS